MEIYKGSMKIKLSDTSISLFEEEEEIYYKELSSNSNLDFNYIKEEVETFFYENPSKKYYKHLIIDILSENLITEQHLFYSLKKFYYEAVFNAELKFFNLDSLFSNLNKINYLKNKQLATNDFLNEFCNIIDFILFLVSFKEYKGFKFNLIPKNKIKSIYDKTKIKVLFLEDNYYYSYSNDEEIFNKFQKISKKNFLFLYYFHKYQKRKKDDIATDLSSVCYF